MDACSDPAGFNAMVDNHWSKVEDCTKAEWGGHNAWCNPPFHQVEPVIQRFLECKRKSPQATSATFVLPAWVGSAWWSLVTANFRVVEYFPPWSHVFTASPVKGTDARRLAGPTRWPVVVVVCEAGPLPSSPGAQVQPTDLTPERVEDLIAQLQTKPKEGEVDPVELCRFGPNLSSDQVDQLKTLLRSFGRDLWAMSNMDLAEPINVIEHHIHVSNPAPISRKGAPRSATENKALNAWVQEMVECGIVGKSDSLNSAPAVIVMKHQEPGDTGPPSVFQLSRSQRGYLWGCDSVPRSAIYPSSAGRWGALWVGRREVCIPPNCYGNGLQRVHRFPSPREGGL